MTIKEAKAILTILKGVSPIMLDISHNADGEQLSKHFTLLLKAANKKKKEYPKYFKSI